MDRITTISIGALVSIVLAFTLGAAALLGAGASTACTLPDDAHPAGSPASPSLDTEQTTNATAIIQTGATLAVPMRGWIIAVAVALQESGLRTLNHGDIAGPDSRGLFQQRAPWGPETERMDPAASARLFYTGGHAGQPGLLDVPHWQSQPLTHVAQAVQRSAHPDAYAHHEHQATDIVSAVGPGYSRANPEDLEQLVSNPGCLNDVGSAAGAVTLSCSVSSRRPSNRACDFPAHGSPTSFTAGIR